MNSINQLQKKDWELVDYILKHEEVAHVNITKKEIIVLGYKELSDNFQHNLLLRTPRNWILIDENRRMVLARYVDSDGNIIPS